MQSAIGEWTVKSWLALSVAATTLGSTGCWYVLSEKLIWHPLYRVSPGLGQPMSETPPSCTWPSAWPPSSFLSLIAVLR